jgi:diketogulonate reductase-like aldo/keto reductase
VPKVKLNDGTFMPVIGLGTFLNTTNIYDIVKKAILEDGYRHIDCSKIYNNEPDVGRAINECIAAGIKREDLYIVSKLWHDDKNRVLEAVDECLARLNLDYLDLWIIHWPRVDVDFESPEKTIKSPPNYLVWKEMEKAVKSGKVRSIGMSNCGIAMLYDTLAGAEIRPVYNQIESHPYFSQHNVKKTHHDYGIKLCAYASIGSSSWPLGPANRPKPGAILTDPVVTAIAQKHGRTNAQIIFAWHHHHETVILVQTSKPERLPENIGFFDI